MSPLSPPADPHAALVLERLRNALADRYALEGEIGRGGMGLVYRARDLRHDREVAIKVLPPDLATAVAAERFLLEIRTAARLLHPHILGLIDSGEADGLLYYIMPHVGGESLRELLRREQRLPLAEAGRIALEVASALAHAHQHGVVHRDVKPENVLLVDGLHAVVTDFGLALALLRSTDRKLTTSRTIVGTVAYMSPEQAGSGDSVDGRADIYSLGCMFFEMLCGHPPFEADTELAVLAQHMTAEPPRISAECPDLPAAVARVVNRALEKEPARRYQTATELSRELEAALAEAAHARARTVARRPPWRRPGVLVAAALAGVLAAVGLAPRPPGLQRLGTLWGAPLDTTRWAILPLRRGAGVPRDAAPEAQLHDAFARWSGIRVLDPARVADAAGRLRAARPDERALRKLAGRVDAGRIVHGDITLVGDSLRIAAALHDGGTGAALEEVVVKVSRAGAADARAFRRIADSLLFPDVPATARDEASGVTSSVPARRAFLRGHRAVEAWHLAAADSAFAQAIAHDDGYAAAQLWLAQVRAWTSDDPQRWRALVDRALARASQLSGPERLLGGALLHMARADFPQACALYGERKRAVPQDFAATFGLGECVRLDSAVVRYARSPSGWRFRGSRHQAVLSYREAFELLPSIHTAYQGNAFERMRRVLLTATSARVDGRALTSDRTVFRAAPAWEGDTLLLVPYPLDYARRWPDRVVSRTAVEAVNHQRATFRDIAAAWRRAFPNDVAPREAMALSLELLGDSTALDTLYEARRLATDAEQRWRLATQEVWLRVKFALPDDHASLGAARELADSLLSSRPAAPAAPSADALAGLAMLTGRVHVAAALSRRAATPLRAADGVTPRAAAMAAALLAYAASGAPADSIHTLERRIVDEVHNTVEVSRQPGVLMTLLARAAPLAFPVRPFSTHAALAGRGNPVIDAQAALLRADARAAQRILHALEATRATRRPADLTLDITFPAAWTLLEAGDAAEAVRWIDPVLNAAPLYPRQVISSVANAGAMMRGLALRADLAAIAGDTAAARRWARPVAILWERADPSLHDVVQRMQALAPPPVANAATRPAPRAATTGAR